MRKFVVVVACLLVGLGAFAQESFVFRDSNHRPDLDYSLATSHYLGQIIANKMHLMKETYTYIEQGTPMSPGQKVIVKKPQIYYAVRKLNKHYKKVIKKGQLSEAEAIDKLSEILDICYVIFDQETADFEKYLSKNKKPEEVEKAFELIVLK